ncbi:phosphatidylinositol alpha-1,6-mannosyltransferase [Winogradskyella wandonensis]|uniref:Phosphatidylinositol alpha-1,6-mannosyltransferase n=1 Tax=Winogradskyella wandonensis TaxID=1442586 RepID=A0A4R1KUG1_9FLAO|nr:glycosyltransferase family 4 protein [Winogradskyella wandonensis]TCK68838.1 phosphatidylinositol alpha-1,6-mannosyltransferase [Winogradskyella wandonensis]
MPDTTKHIVLLTSEFPPLPGGIGNHAYNLAEYLSHFGYKVSVIADQRDTSQNEMEFDRKLKSNIYRVALMFPRFLMYLKRIWYCYKLSKTADTLICSGKFPLWIGAFLKPFVSVELIAVIHGTEVNFSNNSLRKSINWSLKRFDKVIAVSNFTKSLVGDLDLKNVEVIPNGYALSESHSSTDSKIQIEGHPKLLTVGNVTERKGQATVIKHLPKLKKVYPNIHYHCVGLKTEAENLLALAKSLNVSNHVTFHGHVSQEQLNGFYESSDICVMLSQTTDTGDVEGFGIALIEANHFGLPTIGSKWCGIEDAIDDGISGLLIDATKSEDFVDAVKTIFNGSEDFSENAKLWAEQHHWHHIIKQYVDYIEA